MKPNNLGEFTDESGRIFVRCQADPTAPFFIEVTGPVMVAEWRGKTYSINFSGLSLPLSIKDAARQYLCLKLKTNSPQEIGELSAMLRKLQLLWKRDWSDFGGLDLSDLLLVCKSLSITSRNCFRKVYEYSVSQCLAGADEVASIELRSIRFKEYVGSDFVLDWHSERGALTGAEQELVRRAFMQADANESLKDRLPRLFVWIAFETLKRPTQLAEMDKNALWCSAEGGSGEYFLRIPKIKYQVGEKPALWPITQALAREIISYSAVPSVKAIQDKTGRLLVTNGEAKRHKYSVKIKSWCYRRGVISPRTGKPLVLTPYRIRHTGATQMAMQGFSIDEIRCALEHESDQCVQKYIDCLASEMCPLLDRVGRKLGDLFSQLNNAFFVGGTNRFLVGDPILIPAVEQPAVVGGCSSNGACKKHPFFNCYNGCRHFVAWEDGDHERSLKYVEEELARWGRAEGGNERSKILKDLERVYQAIMEVIAKISQLEARDE